VALVGATDRDVAQLIGMRLSEVDNKRERVWFGATAK
jgi:hypothetical protein